MTAPRPELVDDDVVVYLTPWCPYCNMARRLLDTRGIAYRAIDVTGDRTARTWMRELSGQSTVPQIFIRKQSIGGFDELSQLDREGELRSMLAG